MSSLQSSLAALNNPPTLSRLAWVCALLPFLATHVSYLVAASLGHVEWCMPYWDACTSISATGRQMPEKAWFKAGIIPAALLTALFWRGMHGWFSQSPVAHLRRSILAMMLLGYLACGFLTLYTLALGEDGDTFRLMRRTGVTLAFTFTYLSQLLCTHLVGQYARETSDHPLVIRQQKLMTLLLSLLGVGIVSVLLEGLLGGDYDRYEDGFEWIMALMLNLWFADTAILLARIALPATPSH